jgi:predicted RNA-binding Zn-ribbon protein involved in translation (DUF1610 family)
MTVAPTKRDTSERRAPSPIECPECGETLQESAPGSILASLRCSSCGHLLAFDEVIALRDAEQARSREYE